MHRLKRVLSDESSSFAQAGVRLSVGTVLVGVWSGRDWASGPDRCHAKSNFAVHLFRQSVIRKLHGRLRWQRKLWNCRKNDEWIESR